MNRHQPKPRIVIVEDEEIIAADLADRVQNLGCEVAGSTNRGDRAVELVARTRPDLVLMDIVLSGPMDGIAAARIIRERYHTPSVFITARMDDDHLEQAKTALPAGYLLKPFHDQDLKITIEMALHLSRTDAKRSAAEDALKNSEAKYRQLFNHAPAGIYEIDFVHNRIVRINDLACQYMGYTRQEILDIDPNLLMTPDSQARFAQRLAQLAEGKTVPESEEYELLTKDGRTIWALLTVNFLSEAGRVVGASVVAHDITGRKRSEDALRVLAESGPSRGREFYRSLVSQLAGSQGVRYGLLTWLDPADPESVQTLAVWDGQKHGDNFRFPLDGSPTREVVETGPRFYADGLQERFPRDEHLIDMDAQSYWGVPVFDSQGRVFGALALLDDRPMEAVWSRWSLLESFAVRAGAEMEREHMEHALRKSEEKFRLAFDTSPDAININRLEDGLYVDINQGFTDLTGYTRADVIGRTSVEINIWDDLEDRERLVAALQTKGFCENLEARFRRKDGSPTTALMSARLIDFDGRPHIISITRDISERIQAETERNQLENQLRQAQKMQAVGTLAGGIAHDFNNLLQAVAGYTEMLLMDKTESDPDHPHLMAIQNAAGRAAKLVRQLLLFSRKAEIEQSPLDLNHEIRQAQIILERTIPKMVDIQLRLEDDLPPVNADPVQIEQVLLNLGANAADAMPEGGRLTISTRQTFGPLEPDETSEVDQHHAWVLITVADTGQGMDRDTLDHIFEPFFTTKEFGRGTGLGLASVYGIVKSHDGRITCESRPGQGAVFRVHLPALTRPADEGDLRADRSPQRGRGESILLADDEASIRDFAAQALERFGYRVRTAATGEEALEVFAPAPGAFDLVLLDIGMPGMGGRKCLREMRRLDPSAKVLICSGYTTNGHVQEALDQGAAGFVNKPYELANLLENVRRVLDEPA